MVSPGATPPRAVAPVDPWAGSAPLVELDHVSKRFGGEPILEDVSFGVRRGEVFGYLGANGAGKTTTIKLLLGLLAPSSGAARVAGKSPADDPRWVRSRLGYVPESGAIFERLTPREYLTAIGRLHDLAGRPLERRVEALLERFGIARRIDERMDVFSKGTKQKVCLAAALVHDPDVLILDEPLNGLDVETVLTVKELMRSRAAEGKTVFYTSHLVDVVQTVCTRVAVLHRGRIRAIGTLPELYQRTETNTLEAALLKIWRGVEGTP